MSKLLEVEKSAYRPIKSGVQYEHLFPPANMQDEIRNKDGNVKDTVKIMQGWVLETLNDTRLIAPKLRGVTLGDTCFKVWDFVYSHLQYKLDEKGIEQLRRPARSWHDRAKGVDCDCMSIFVSSILTNLDIPHSFRITKYDGDWQHVYVIVPKTNRGHYTIDCVAHHFDEEKKFTDKLDFHMTQLNGIPIAVLSGFGERPDDDLFNILTGVDFSEVDYIAGLGQVPSKEEELKAIYNHLIRTRDFISKNPQSVVTSGGARAHIEMLNYAISNWNTPNRDRALELLEKEEERWNEHNGISGFDSDDDEINGLGKSKGKKKFWTKVKETTKKVGQGVTKVGKTLVRYNPLSMAVRGGFLLAMKINLLGIAKHLYPAYLTSDQAKSRGIDTDKWQRSKNALSKIEKLFIDTLQGKSENLKQAIMNGRAAKQFKGFGELGEPATIATVITSAAPLITAYAAVKKEGLTDPKEEASLTDTGGAMNTEDKEGFIRMIKKWWQKNFGSESASSPEGVDEKDKEPNESGEGGTSKEVSKSEGGGDGEDSDGEPGAWDKFKDFAKDNPVPVGVGAVALTAGVAYGLHHLFKKKSKKQEAALSGTGKKKSKKSKKKTKKPATQKMKSIILK